LIQGTAINTSGYSLAAEGCTFTSEYLGIVCSDRDDIESQQKEEGSDWSVRRGVVNLRDCTFSDSWCGAFFSKDILEEDKRCLMACNTFENNWEEDIYSGYEYTGATVQPWRKGTLLR
jgi:hypothetical protein